MGKKARKDQELYELVERRRRRPGRTLSGAAGSGLLPVVPFESRSSSSTSCRMGTSSTRCQFSELRSTPHCTRRKDAILYRDVVSSTIIKMCTAIQRDTLWHSESLEFVVIASHWHQHTLAWLSPLRSTLSGRLSFCCFSFVFYLLFFHHESSLMALASANHFAISDKLSFLWFDLVLH